MPQDPLQIEDMPGPKPGQRIFRLVGPLTITNLFDFQSKVRADNSRLLILDFSQVPYIDSAGIGSLVGAHVSHTKDGCALALVGVNERLMNALKVTHVDQFFRFFPNVTDATC